MSGFISLEAVVVEGVADVEVDAVRPGEGVVATEEPAGRDDDIDGFPLMWVDVVAGVAGTVPKDFTTLSFIGFGAAGDDDIGADASSIEPKVTDEPVERVSGESQRKWGWCTPCFAAAAPMLLRGMLTPSLIGTAWPRALGRREWVRWGWD